MLAARSLAAAALPTAILQHSLRTFLLARAYAAATDVAFDEEGLAVVSLFHDIGLCEPYRDTRQPFPFNSSRAMLSFLAEHDVSAARSAALVDAVDFHFQMWPQWSAGPEAGLLHVGAYMDMVRLRRGRVRAEADRIDRAYDRTGLVGTFIGRTVRSIGSPRSLVGLLAPGLCARRHRPVVATG